MRAHRPAFHSFPFSLARFCNTLLGISAVPLTRRTERGISATSTMHSQPGEAASHLDATSRTGNNDRSPWLATTPRESPHSSPQKNNQQQQQQQKPSPEEELVAAKLADLAPRVRVAVQQVDATRPEDALYFLHATLQAPAPPLFDATRVLLFPAVDSAATAGGAPLPRQQGGGSTYMRRHKVAETLQAATARLVGRLDPGASDPAAALAVAIGVEAMRVRLASLAHQPLFLAHQPDDDAAFDILCAVRREVDATAAAADALWGACPLVGLRQDSTLARIHDDAARARSELLGMKRLWDLTGHSRTTFTNWTTGGGPTDATQGSSEAFAGVADEGERTWGECHAVTRHMGYQLEALPPLVQKSPLWAEQVTAVQQMSAALAQVGSGLGGGAADAPRDSAALRDAFAAARDADMRRRAE